MSGDLLTGRGPTTLADGTPLEELFDLERRRISARVFSDPEIFRLEMSQVFGRSWLFLGLESEIPNPGDYAVRPMAGDSVIVTRSNDGGINVVLNRCTHRGTQLCVTDCGNSQRFRCPYHGWLFSPDGRLEAMPSERDWLGGGDKADYAIRSARVATRGGLIFATWDDDMPSFETYLGDFLFYFDMLFCGLDKNLVSVGPPHRWSLPINWKIGAENFVGDTYHLQTAHASLTDIGMVPALEMDSTVGAEPRWGHGFFAPVFSVEEQPPLETTMSWLPPEVLPQLERHLNPEQFSLLRRGAPPFVATLFPNLSWLASPFFFFLRTWQPVGPGEIELRTWVMAHPDANPEQRRAKVQGLNLTFGTTGMFEQDDAVIWSRIQRTHESLIGSGELVSYGCTHGAPDKQRGYVHHTGEWPGPCNVWQGFPSDDHLWNFHMRWLHLMNGGEL